MQLVLEQITAVQEEGGSEGEREVSHLASPATALLAGAHLGANSGSTPSKATN